MIQSFASDGTRDIFDGVDSKWARKTCPAHRWSTAARKLDQLNLAEDSRDLRAPPGHRLEALSGTRKGQHSIRIDDQYRVCFRWTGHGPEDVGIVDDHD